MMKEDINVILFDALEDIQEACQYPADTFPDLIGHKDRYELILQRIAYMSMKALERYNERSSTTKKSS